MLARKRLANAAQETIVGFFLRGMQRGETIALIALLLVIGLAWAWTVHLAIDMKAMADMPNMAAAYAPSWDIGSVVLTWAMWSVMMAAMMLPAATPIALLHHRVGRHNAAQGAKAPSTSLLISGYVLVWTAFSALATAAQIALSMTLQITPAMALVDARWAGAVLIAAGLYQFTAFKQYCLIRCSSPFVFLNHHYHPGAWGALRMGLLHGFYCLCCCWAAMALLFVGGVMNLLWVAGLTVFVLIEKLLPFGRSIGLVLGALALAMGLYLIAGYSLPAWLSNPQSF